MDSPSFQYPTARRCDKLGTVCESTAGATMTAKPTTLARTAALGALLLAGALGAWSLTRASVAAEQTSEVVVDASSLVETFRPVGNAGCAASACHGGPALSLTSPAGADAWRGSSTHWQARDPHRHATSALSGKLAADIMAVLNVPGPDGKPLTATQYDRCLACHSDPQQVKPGVPTRAVAPLGCESCHGDGGGYLRPHTTWRSPGERAAGVAHTGFADLNDLAVRAGSCAGCHVGWPESPAGTPGGSEVVRDMNHDMIAAGHPRLDKYDFAEYQRRLTPHWSEKDRAKSSPRGDDFEWRAWLIGRAATAEACAMLTAERANDASHWPELAEWRCASCHQNIAGPARETWGDSPGQVARKSGLPPWQSAWPFDAAAGAEASTLPALAEYMGSRRRPEPAQAFARASTAAGQLSAWSQAVARNPDDLRPRARSLMPAGAATLGDPADAQHALRGLAALARSTGSRPDDSLRLALKSFAEPKSGWRHSLDSALKLVPR